MFNFIIFFNDIIINIRIAQYATNSFTSRKNVRYWEHPTIKLNFDIEMKYNYFNVKKLISYI